MQIRNRIKTIKPETSFEAALEKELISFTSELADILNKGLLFADNHNMELITFTTHAIANTETAVAHTLGRVPIGFIVYSQDKAASIYNGTTAFTSTNIYVRADVASVVVKALVF